MLGLSPLITILINTMEGKGPRVILSLVNVLQSPTGSVGNSNHFSNVWLRDFGQWTTKPSSTWNFEGIGGFRANLRWVFL